MEPFLLVLTLMAVWWTDPGRKFERSVATVLTNYVKDVSWSDYNTLFVNPRLMIQ